LDERLLYFESPIGFIEIRGVPDGITGVGFADSPAARAAEEPYPCMAEAKRQLLEYFDGRRGEFDLPLIFSCTDFQRRVYGALVKIPYGVTSTYGEVAASVGQPTAVRAVGGANHANRHVIVIPCHRVVHKDGKSSGYGGGIRRKEFLLELERKGSFGMSVLAMQKHRRSAVRQQSSRTSLLGAVTAGD